MTLEQTWWIRCDRSEEDGITCMSMGGPTPQSAEANGQANGWTSYDGYHECPRHKAR